MVTGATGFVGSALVAYLSGRGRTVRAVVRRDDRIWPDGVTVCNVADAKLPTFEDITCIVHCAARAHIMREEATDPLAAFRTVNRDATLALARAAAAAGVKRFIFISSIGVNGSETKGRGYSVGDEPAPHSPYAVSKHEAEQGLAIVARDTGLETVIIRPPLVIGEHPKGNLGALERAMARGVPLPFGSVRNNRRDLVSLETLSSLIETCIDTPAAASETFMVSDGTPLSTRGIVEEIARLAKLKLRLLPVPASLLGTALRLIGKDALASQLLGDLEVDIRHTIDTLGWHPPTRVAKGNL
jgi:UDP-4-keto-D-QuiNAc 4-reductase